MPSPSSVSANRARVSGADMDGWLPSRSVGPLPGSNSAARSRCPARCSGTRRVPYTVVPSAVKTISRSAAGTSAGVAAAGVVVPTASASRAAARWRIMRVPPSDEGVLHQGHGRAGVIDLENQTGVLLVCEFDHDGFRRVLDVPEDLVAVVVESARDDHAG